ncbi:HEAT repeat domain-containing protein [Acidicapsa ligni]|uniref:HEAT repeat domain-containing protein n=1 Tax=Acidicapsa ligni TaxID=542300 RepID=UPI0037C093FC
MIVFCTECWHETDSSHRTCPRCGANLAINPHSYEEKLTSALDHPLAEARVRACWLIGLNNVQAAATKLMSVVESDTDLFVRRAAVQALGKIHARVAVPLLQSLIGLEDHWMEAEARKSIHHIEHDSATVERSSEP